MALFRSTTMSGDPQTLALFAELKSQLKKLDEREAAVKAKEVDLEKRMKNFNESSNQRSQELEVREKNVK